MNNQRPEDEKEVNGKGTGEGIRQRGRTTSNTLCWSGVSSYVGHIPDYFATGSLCAFIVLYLYLRVLLKCTP